MPPGWPHGLLPGLPLKSACTTSSVELSPSASWLPCVSPSAHLNQRVGSASPGPARPREAQLEPREGTRQLDSQALPLLGSPVELQDAPEINSWTLARMQGANVTSPGREMSSQWGSGGAPEWAFLPEASSPLSPSSSSPLPLPSPPPFPPPAGPGIGFGAGSASKAIFSGGRRGLSSTLSSHFRGSGPTLRGTAASWVTARGRHHRRSPPQRDSCRWGVPVGG